MKKPRSVATLTIEPEQLSALETLAENFGMKWGNQPNISKFMRAIATGKLIVISKPELDELKINHAHLKELVREEIKKEIIEFLQ